MIALKAERYLNKESSKTVPENPIFGLVHFLMAFLNLDPTLGTIVKQDWNEMTRLY